ncbi:MAG: hypothetical protein JO103_11085 [Candidatus Eremiobacteraeota bacterium]|nr:hypothetical protein [Candidatus Eremiobacteraeota bacterium]
MLERRLAGGAPAARLAQRRGRFEQLRERLERDVPALLRRRAERVPQYAARLDAAMTRYLERRRARFETVRASWSGHDPKAILQRGYAIVKGDDGQPLTDATLVPPGTYIQAELARGILTARVEREGTHGGRQIGLFRDLAD